MLSLSFEKIENHFFFFCMTQRQQVDPLVIPYVLFYDVNYLVVNFIKQQLID